MKTKIKKFCFGAIQSKWLLGFVVLLLVLKIAAVLVPVNFPYNIFFADITKSSLENFINQTRQATGLRPLAESQKLNQAAQLKAEHMVQEQYFSHTSPGGIAPWFWFKQAGYNYKYAGENLAVGFYESEEVFNAWLNSPSHKANIVNPNYAEVGTAVVKGFGAGNAIIVVQEFGSQLPVKQSVASQPTTTQPETQTPETQTNVQPTAQPTQPVQTNERVLSQEIESQSFLGVPIGNTSGGLISRLLNSILYDYNNLLQAVIYGVSLIMIGILFALILFNFRTTFKRELVLRAVLIVILLSAATLLNREIIISLIPHQIII